MSNEEDMTVANAISSRRRNSKASKRQAEKISLHPDQDQQTMPMPAKRPKSDDCPLGERQQAVQCMVNHKSKETEAAATNKGNKPQNQHRKDQNERPKSRFHALQKHFHLCPVTVEEFRKFTNIDPLIKTLCLELYGKVEKYFRHQLNRLYMFFYLMPNLRSTYPLSKVKVLPNCPEGLKQKIFEIPNIPESASNEINALQLLTRQENKIPTNANVDRGKNVEPSVSHREDSNKNIHSIPQKISVDAIGPPTTDCAARPRSTHLENDIQQLRLTEANIENIPANTIETAQSGQNTKPMLSNTRVTILENRLLENVPESLIKKHANVGTHFNNKCRSCNLPYEKFIENSNILELVRETDSVKKEVIIHKMYKQFLRKDESVFSTSLNVNVSLVKILIEFEHFCENCKPLIESSPEEELEISLATETNNLSSMTNKAGGGCASNGQEECLEPAEKRTAPLLQINKISSAEEEMSHRFQQIEDSVSKRTALDHINPVNNSITSTTQSMESAIQQTIEPGAQLLEERPAQHHISLVNELQPGKPGTDAQTNVTEGTKSQLANKVLGKSSYTKFKSRLLHRLCLEQRNFANTSMPVSLEQFIKTSYYEVPVKQILNDFCEQNKEHLAVLENDKVVCDALVTYYYKMYFTFPPLRNKYPLKIKMCPGGMRNKMLSFVEVKGKEKENVMQNKDLLCEEVRLQTKAIVTTSPDKINTKENENKSKHEINDKTDSNKNSLEEAQVGKTTEKSNAVKELTSSLKSPQKLATIRKLNEQVAAKSLNTIQSPQNVEIWHKSCKATEHPSGLLESPQQQQQNIKSTEQTIEMLDSTSANSRCTNPQTENAITDGKSMESFVTTGKSQKQHNIRSTEQSLETEKQNSNSISTKYTKPQKSMTKKISEQTADKSLNSIQGPQNEEISHRSCSPKELPSGLLESPQQQQQNIKSTEETIGKLDSTSASSKYTNPQTQNSDTDEKSIESSTTTGTSQKQQNIRSSEQSLETEKQNQNPQKPITKKISEQAADTEQTIEKLDSTSASSKYSNPQTENAVTDGKSMESSVTTGKSQKQQNIRSTEQSLETEKQDSNSTSTKYKNPQTESAISDGRSIESSVVSCTSQKHSSETLKSPLVSIEPTEKLDLNPDNSTSANRIIIDKSHSNMGDVDNQEMVNTCSTLKTDQPISEVSPQRPRTRKLPAHFLKNRDSSSASKNATNQKSKHSPTVKSANNIKNIQNPESSVEVSPLKEPTSIFIKLPPPKPRTRRLSFVETSKVSSAEEESSYRLQRSEDSTQKILPMTASDNLNKSVTSTPENMECSKHQFIEPVAQLLKAGPVQHHVSPVSEMEIGKPVCDTVPKNMEIEFAEGMKSQLETKILDKRWYARFKSRLLQKLCLEQRNLANTSMPVSLEQFKKTSHYEVPVKQIINDFCEQNLELLAVLENDKVVYDALVTYYYKIYFTFPPLRNKYPLKIKMCPGGMRSKMTSFVEINGSENVMQKKDLPYEETRLQTKVIVISSPEKINSNEPPLTIEIHQTEKRPSKIEINDKTVSNSNSLGEEQFRKTVDKSGVVKESSSIIKSPQKSNSRTLCEEAVNKSLNDIQFPQNEENVHKSCKAKEHPSESPQQHNISSSEQKLGTIEKLDFNSGSTKRTNPSTENAVTDGNSKRKSVETLEVAKQLDSNVPNKMSINITSENSATVVSQKPATSSEICVKSPPRLRKRRLSVQLPDNSTKLNSNSVHPTSLRIENSNTDKTHSTKVSQHKENDAKKEPSSFAINVPQRPQTRRLSLLLAEVNKDSYAETSKVLKNIKEHEVSAAQSTDAERSLSTAANAKNIYPQKSNQTLPSPQPKEVTTEVISTKCNHLTAETSQSAASKTSCNECIDLSVGSNSSCQRITRRRKTMDSDAKRKVEHDLKQRLDRAMQTFFQNFSKNFSLPYMLRVSSGLKQRIIEVILTLDLDTFRTITDIYQGSELYKNEDIFKQIYKYALKTNRIWPNNLFIKLEDICLLLKMKSIPVPEAATILMHISPRFLHWSDLQTSTNFIEYVKMYYFKHTYEHLDVNNIAKIEKACIEYYNRCWSLDDWVGGVPVIAEHLQKLIFVQENPTALDVELLQEIQTENTSDNRPESTKQQTSKTTTRSGQLKPTTQIIFPEATPERSGSANSIFMKEPEPEDMVSLQFSSSSEDSIPMVVIPNSRSCEVTNIPTVTIGREIMDENTLPTTEADITIFTEPQIDLETQMCQYTDPLHCSIANDNNIINLETHDFKAEENTFEEDGNASDSDVAFIPKVVKTEDNKLLRNLLFVLNDDDAMQCSRLSDEVLDVDNSQNVDIEDSNLPPSQIDFDDHDEPAKLSFPTTTAPKTSGDLLISGNCGAELNVGQGLLSSGVDLTETQTQSQSHVMDAVQFIKSLNDNESNRTTPENIPPPLTYMEVDQLEVANYESFCTIPNAQRFPSTFEETVTTATVPIQIPKASLARSTKHSKTKSKVTQTITTTRTDVVPQLTHPLRALPVVAVTNNPCSSNIFEIKQIISSVAAAKQKQMKRIPENLEVFEEIPSDFLPGPTSTQTKLHQQQSEPNQQQLQVIPTPPTLQVSQELSSDKTLFNNSSLLRICDHNYVKSVEKYTKEAKSDTAQERPTRSRSNSTDRPSTDKPLKKP